MSLESYCCSCTYLEDNADYEGKYYCERRGRLYASDPKCYNYCEAYSRSNSARENMYNNSKGHQEGGCYITTIMCNILGYADNCYYLEVLRSFRNNVLQTNSKYFPILVSYDIIGPQIAKSLINDKNKKIIAEGLVDSFIRMTIKYIEENKIEEAINLYVAMTISLAKRYNIEINNMIIDANNINQEETQLLGHGRKLVKSK